MKKALFSFGLLALVGFPLSGCEKSKPSPSAQSAEQPLPNGGTCTRETCGPGKKEKEAPEPAANASDASYCTVDAC